MKTPSNLRSGYGAVTSQDTLTSTRVLPSRTSALPYSAPNERERGRYWLKGRPSRRMFSLRAERRNCCSLVEGSASRPMVEERMSGCQLVIVLDSSNMHIRRDGEENVAA